MLTETGWLNARGGLRLTRDSVDGKESSGEKK